MRLLIRNFSPVSCYVFLSDSNKYSPYFWGLPSLLSNVYRWFFFRGLKRPERETDHSPRANAEIKNAWSYTSTHPHIFIILCLTKHRDNFTLFTLFPDTLSLQSSFRVKPCKATGTITVCIFCSLRY